MHNTDSPFLFTAKCILWRSFNHFWYVEKLTSDKSPILKRISYEGFKKEEHLEIEGCKISFKEPDIKSWNLLIQRKLDGSLRCILCDIYHGKLTLSLGGRIECPSYIVYPWNTSTSRRVCWGVGKHMIDTFLLRQLFKRKQENVLWFHAYLHHT